MKFLVALIAGMFLFSGPLLAQEVSGDFGGGSVLHGYDPGTCNAAREGALRFNSTTNAWGYCDGANWAYFNASFLTAGTNVTIAASGTLYTSFGHPGFNSTEANRPMIMPSRGVISRFYLLTTTAQNAGGSLVCTLRKNSADTSVVITVPAGGAAGVYSDTSNTASVVAGDIIGIRCVNNYSGGVSASMMSFSAMFSF